MYYRWAVVLSSFNLDIVHRAGKLHGNADALSRPPFVNDIDPQATSVELSSAIRFVAVSASDAEVLKQARQVGNIIASIKTAINQSAIVDNAAVEEDNADAALSAFLGFEGEEIESDALPEVLA